MQRLVVELDAAEFARLSGEESVAKVEALEVLNFLKEDPEEFVTICRVALKDPSDTFDDVFRESGSDVKVIDRDGARRYTALFRGKPRQDPMLREFLAAGGYMSTPFEIRDGKARLTFVGTPREVRALLALARNWRVRHKVVRLTDAGLPSSSPLNSLTERQRQVITSAYELGYYDVPRRIKTEELAKGLGIRGSTAAMHRIKAERRLLSELLKESKS
jgi:predicted DNA binding protein